jgi:ubiquinone/menaquinone biosynthesis C-methylase UbiE
MAYDLPFSDNSFDIVVSSLVHHLVPETSCAFREVRRVLRRRAFTSLTLEGLWHMSSLQAAIMRI